MNMLQFISFLSSLLSRHVSLLKERHLCKDLIADIRQTITLLKMSLTWGALYYFRTIIDYMRKKEYGFLLTCSKLTPNCLSTARTGQTYPLYVRRICRYLECEEKDIISEYSEETRAGVFMPWCYDSVKMLRRHLFYYLHDNDISLDKAVSRTGILKSRLEFFLSYGNLTDLETANLKKLGPAMEKHVIEYLDAMADIRDPDKGDVFESPPMLPLKE